MSPDDPPSITPHLDHKEVRQVREHKTIHAGVVHEAIRLEGEEELARSFRGLALSGVAAGLCMGFSMIAEGLIRSKLPHEPWAPLVSKFGYSFGFLFVILGRQQLFTENTLTAILPLLAQRTWPNFRRVARLWGIVFLANALGAHLVAWSVVHLDAFDAPAREAFLAIGREAVSHSGAQTLVRAIFAGWIIATLVWLLPAAENARVWVIILLTYLVALGGFSHIIAGQVEVLYLVVAGQLPWTVFAVHWLIPTFLGNCFGGVLLVAALNHSHAVETGARG